MATHNKYSFGGLLADNIYANNKMKKEQIDKGLLGEGYQYDIDGKSYGFDEKMPRGFAAQQNLLNDPRYLQAVAKNQNVMNAINNPTPQNIQQRVNAYSTVTDDNMQYPAEVLAEPKKVNMLQEYLFGNPYGYQPTVDQKKLVYKASKNLTTAEKLFFEANPEKFQEYVMKFGDFAPQQTGTTADGLTNTGQKTAEYFGLGDPNSKYAVMYGGESEKFDPKANYKGTTAESRMTPDGRERSYAQMIFDINQNKDANFSNINAEATALGKQGNRQVQYATYDDEGNVTWSDPETFFYNPAQQTIDKDFGTKVYNKWAIQGGYASEVANIQNFNEVEDLLNDPRATTSGLSYELTPEKITRLYESGYSPTVNEETGKRYEVNNALDLVRAVVFQSLKKTLGGQFTEREAERLVEATYNPSLPPEVNLKRIMALKSKMIETFRSQQRAVQYYEKNNGTLYGYDTTVSGIDLADLSKESISDFVDRVAMESFSADDYASMSDKEASDYYTNKASVLERQFMATLFNIKD